jgi:Zn-dependent protease with chaperone function
MASVVMLAGFPLLAAAQLCIVVVPVLMLLAVLPGSVAAQVGVPLCIATVGVMAYATWHALHTRRTEPAGVPVTRADAPQLWAVIDEAAARAGTRIPDAVTVVAEAAATLSERSRLLGLLGGRRDLYLGLPLLQAWDVAHLRALVAHELGHGSPRSGRLAPLAYRGRVAVGRTIPRISRRNLAGPVLSAYARLYRRVDTPFSQAHELAADRFAAEFAGTAAIAGVLRDLPVLDAAQRLFYAEYLGPGWQAGHVPDDIFGGFLRVLAARAGELASLRARTPVAEPTGWDPHPPLPVRLAALAGAPASTQPASTQPASTQPAPTQPASTQPASTQPASTQPASTQPVPGEPAAQPGRVQSFDGESTGDAAASDRPAGAGVTLAADDAAPAASVAPRRTPAASDGAGRPAGDLVPDLPGLGRALQAIVFPPQGRTTVGWDEFFGAARTVEMQREADAALSTLSDAAGTPVTDAGEVLDLAADGRLLKAAEAVFPELPSDRVAERACELVKLLLALAALRSGAARWRHSWTGTAELVASDGAQLDLGELAALAGSPDTVAEARAGLAKLGIDPAAAGQVGTTRTAARAGVVGGLVNLVVDGSRADLLIVDTGLFLVPGLPRSQNGAAKRRLAELAAADEPHATAPGSRFVPYEDVTRAALVRRTPKTWELGLRGGGTLTVRTSLDSDELPGGWAALDDAVAFLARERRTSVA